MSYHRLKLRHLNALLAVTEQGGLVAAAKALKITQPAVSKALAELEDIVGQRLLERTRKGIELTTAGRILVRYTGSGIRTLREGLDSIAQARSADAPILVIGVLPNVAATVLPPAVQRFLHEVPSARVRVRTGSNAYLIGLLRQGELDVVIGRLAEPSDMQGLSFEYLYPEPVVFAVRPGHPLLAAPALRLAMLKPYRMVLPDAGTRLREAVDQFLLASGLGMPDLAIETIDVSFGRSFVLNSDAIWCAPVGVVETDVSCGTLVRLALPTASSAGPVGLSLRADRLPSDALQRLLTEIRLSAAERVPAVDGARWTPG
ncbi:pca operon transcription factor PcaQ [Pigmentiphaga sp. NML030171]|uniref:pca operon transcription factor PcaQ n=1 Tax=Pigmentiphaga sp. NML030171 TaxID=2008676 RepID=UPI00159617E9|nr:pca operon transcription factor PcaQ [Pigmentiphaga sp. NML030171]